MKKSSSGRATNEIEMFSKQKIKWQAVLTNLRISTPKHLIARVRDVNSEPIARKALKGEKLAKTTWASVFAGLKLERKDFFSDAEWLDRDLTTQWQMLWNLAEDASDRFGLVLPPELENNDLNDALPERQRLREHQRLGADKKFVKTIISRTSVLIQIPGGISGYLILLEQDAQGNIILLSPSPLMVDPLLTGAIQQLPQYPPSPFEFFQPITVGTNNLWASVFAKLPAWKWLADAQKRPLRLQLVHLKELFEYVEKQPQGTEIWRSSYVVTD
jgi:hypothetical protein